jgi:radical SAM superfamily enzyme YgiQ (UPF0313 family)
MRVVIANPPWPGEGYGTRSNVRWPHRRGDKVLTFPIYLAYAVAVLEREGFGVIGIDAVDKELGIFDFVSEIKRINPKVILLEVSTPSISYDLQTAELLKEELPETIIIFCGPHASFFHNKIIGNYIFVDVCIRGEFEFSLLDICSAIKRNEGLEKIAGITFRKRFKTIINPERNPIKSEMLDNMPYPDRHFFKIENYQQAYYGGKKTALMISSRGCPYHCSFCLWPNTLTGHIYRTRSPKSIVDEIEYLIDNHKVDEIYFDDDTFTIDAKRVKLICKEILRRKIKIPWLCNARVDNVDFETLKIMREAGCREAFYGLESGSDEILREISKGIDTKKLFKAIRMTQKAGIVASGSFVIGLPKESHKTIKETLKFAKKAHADYVQFTLASPFPGTKLFEEVKRKGLLHINSWEDLDGCHGPILSTEYLSKNELAGIIRKMYINYYTSPTIIWQNIKSIRGLRDTRRILRGIRSVFSRIIFYKK